MRVEIPIEFDVPEWARYVGIDPDGEVWMYSERPYWDSEPGDWISDAGYVRRLCVINEAYVLRDIDWYWELVELKK